MIPPTFSGQAREVPTKTAPPSFPKEVGRLLAVCGMAHMEPGRDPMCDEVAAQAASLCGASIGLVTLLGEREQTFRGKVGIDAERTARDEAFCLHTILQDEPMVIEDARDDPRFAHLALVTGPPFIRFYAGAPIVDGTGLPLGSVCVLDTVPRALSSTASLKLQRMATMVGVVFEVQRVVGELLGPRSEAPDLRAALGRIDRAMEPLLAKSNGFRPSNDESL